MLQCCTHNPLYNFIHNCIIFSRDPLTHAQKLSQSLISTRHRHHPSYTHPHTHTHTHPVEHAEAEHQEIAFHYFRTTAVNCLLDVKQPANQEEVSYRIVSTHAAYAHSFASLLPLVFPPPLQCRPPMLCCLSDLTIDGTYCFERSSVSITSSHS